MTRTCPMCGRKEEVESADDGFVCPSCGTAVGGSPEVDLLREKALRKVRPPAVGLIVVGLLQILFGCLGAAGKVFEDLILPRLLSDDDRFVSWGAEDTFYLLFLCITPVVGSLLFIGGREIRKLRSRRWAIIAAVAALIPTPFFIFSVPFGIWSLIVLTRPTVTAVFETTAAA